MSLPFVSVEETGRRIVAQSSSAKNEELLSNDHCLLNLCIVKPSKRKGVSRVFFSKDFAKTSLSISLPRKTRIDESAEVRDTDVVLQDFSNVASTCHKSLPKRTRGQRTKHLNVQSPESIADFLQQDLHRDLHGWSFMSLFERSFDLIRSVPLNDVSTDTLSQIIQTKIMEFVDAPNVEQSIDLLKSIYSSEEHGVIETIGSEEEYRNDTTYLATKYKLTPSQMERLSIVAIDELTVRNCSRKIDVYVNNGNEKQGDNDWNLGVSYNKITMKEFLERKEGFARDLDLRKLRGFKEIKQGLRQTFPRLMPLTNEDMCKDAFEPIPGCNTLYGYYKFAPTFTRPHIESAGLLSVNANIGPGSSTWLVVELSEWDRILSIVQKKNINPRYGVYWPDVTELEQLGINVKTFEQGPGDVVIVNPGTVHFVEGTGNSGHVSWNLAFPSKQQIVGMALAVAINSTYGKDSDIPEERFFWFMAKHEGMRKVCCTDRATATLLGSVLLSSIMNHMYERAANCENEVRCDYLKEDEVVKCNTCKVELYYHGYTITNIERKVDDSMTDEEYCSACAKKESGKQTFTLFRNPEENLRIFVEFARRFL